MTAEKGLELRVVTVANEIAREKLYTWIINKQEGFAGDQENSEGFWMVRMKDDEYLASNGHFYYKMRLSGGLIEIDLWQNAPEHPDGWRRYPVVKR